jgi:ankyrin repeat protein
MSQPGTKRSQQELLFRVVDLLARGRPEEEFALLGRDGLDLSARFESTDDDHHAIDGMTALHLASWHERADVVRMMLRSGARVDVRDSVERTALMIAAAKGNDGVVSALIEAGSDVNGVDAEGRTALMWGAKHGTTGALQQLLTAGARKVARDRVGANVLAYAVRNVADESVLAFLLEQGVSPRVATYRGRSPLHDAAARCLPRAIELLLNHGALVEAADSQDRLRRPLHCVARGSSPMAEQAAQLLLQKGADVNARAAHGDTPLIEAVEAGLTSVSRLLIEAGAELEAVDDDGETAILRGVWSRQWAVVDLLIERGANLHHVSNRGDSVLTMIKQQAGEPDELAEEDRAAHAKLRQRIGPGAGR